MSDISSMLHAISTMSEDMSRMSQQMTMHMEMTGMDMSTPTQTASSAVSTATSAVATSMAGMADMAGMSDSMSGMSTSQCKMSMLWNWNTIDSCFLSSGWRITSKGKFAGTCIGVFLWVVFLVFLGNLRRRFDVYIAKNARRRYMRTHEPISMDEGIEKPQSRFREHAGELELNAVRPNLLEQLIRALLFAFEYSISWLLGLILMSYNGYVIISAFIGAALGFMFAEWDFVKTDTVEKVKASSGCCS